MQLCHFSRAKIQWKFWNTCERIKKILRKGNLVCFPSSPFSKSIITYYAWLRVNAQYVVLNSSQNYYRARFCSQIHPVFVIPSSVIRLIYFYAQILLCQQINTLGRSHNTREKYWTLRSRVGVQKVPEPKIGTHNNLRGQVPIGTWPWISRSSTWPSRSGTFPSTYIDFSLKMHLFQLNSSIKLHELY